MFQNFIVFGYSRTKMSDEELRNMISKTLTCRIDQRYVIMSSPFNMQIFAVFMVLELMESMQRELRGQNGPLSGKMLLSFGSVQF